MSVAHGPLRQPVLVSALVATCALLPAQKREPVRGTAVTAAGEPWIDARIELLSRPVADDDRFGEADVLRATSDDKGRFEVLLLPGRRYLAWAHRERDDGTYAASRALADVRAGLPLELQAEAPRPHARVRIAGLEPWRARGKIVCTLMQRDGVLLTQRCLEQDGALRLPAFPGRRAALEILCDGQPLLPWPPPVDLTTADEQKLAVEPPRPLRFRCLDRAQQPIAGAAFFAADLNGRHAARELARSGADGELIATLPLRPDRAMNWVNYPMLLLAPGRAPRAWIGTFKVAAAYDGSQPLMTFVLDDGRRLQSRLCLGDAPLATAQLRALDHMANADGGPTSMREIPRAVPLGADGAFAVDTDPRFPVVLSVFLPPAATAQLPQAKGFPLHPELVVAAVAGDDATPLPGRIDLLQLAALDVQVLGVDGAPADGAEVGVVLKGDWQQPLLRAATDRSGRVRLLLPRGLQLRLCCWSGDGIAFAEVATADLQAPLRPRLQPVQRLPGKLVLGNGKPVPFAELVFFTGQGRRADSEAAALAQCIDNHLRATSGADGTFALPLYPGLRYSLSHVRTADDDHYPRGPEFTVGEDQPQELLIDLSARR